MSNGTDLLEDDYTSYGEYKAGMLIWKIVPPVLIILGTFGNVLSILVLTRKTIRVSTTALYLTVLAVSDLFVLYTGLLRQWIVHLFDTDVRHVSPTGCKINIWFVYTSLDFSAWILIAVTLERVISAWLPHSARTRCTKHSAVIFMSSILVFLLLLNCHMLYGMVFKYDENGDVTDKCTEIDEGYVDFFNKIWPWIDFCAFCLVPFTVIIVGNSLILFKVIQSQNKTKSRVVPSIRTANGTRQGHVGKQSSMTAMLFTLNVVFLLSTSPVSIYNIGYVHWNDDAKQHNDNRAFAVLDLWWAIVNMLMYTNNSLNFLLYCLSGTKFRREVVRMFCTRKQNAGGLVPSVHSNYSRTKFDNSSASPVQQKKSTTPEKSDDIPLQENGHVNTGSTEKIDDIKISAITMGNTLHPSSALNIRTLNVQEAESSNVIATSSTL